MHATKYAIVTRSYRAMVNGENNPIEAQRAQRGKESGRSKAMKDAHPISDFSATHRQSDSCAYPRPTILPQDSNLQWRQGVELGVTSVCSGVFGSHNVPNQDGSNLLGLEVAEEEVMVDHLVSAPGRGWKSTGSKSAPLCLRSCK